MTNGLFREVVLNILSRLHMHEDYDKCLYKDGSESACGSHGVGVKFDKLTRGF